MKYLGEVRKISRVGIRIRTRDHKENGLHVHLRVYLRERFLKITEKTAGYVRVGLQVT